jgi:outer membrane protein assembly factor BamB
MIAAPGLVGTRRAVLGGALALLGGCSSMPWSSGRPKLPEAPQPTGRSSAKLAWSLRLATAGAGFAPVVVGDSVYAAGADGTLARIEAAGGRVRWQVQAARRLSTGVGSDGEIVVVTGRDGQLIAHGAAAGRPLWTTALGAEAVTVPAVALGRVVLRTSDNRISAFDPATGQRRWSVSRQPSALVLRQTAGLSIAPGSAYAGLPGGRLIAIGLDGGQPRWEAAVSNPRGANEIERIADIVGSPVASSREVCAASYQGKVACFEAATGRALWARDVAAVGGIEADARLVALTDERGHVHAFSRTGASLWRQEALARREPSAPVAVGNHLVLGDIQGQVYVLSRDNGAIVARFPTDGTPMLAQGVRFERLAILQTSGGTLVAIEVD